MKFHPLEFKTSKMIRDYHLDGRPIVAMVSGGPDSLALALVLKTLSGGGPFHKPFDLSVFHGNHGKRGEESNEDADFVKEFCSTHSIQFHLDHFSRNVTETKNTNFHLSARQWRYKKAFDRCPVGGVVATGHHHQDNIESILMHLIRGTGIQGLKGLEVLSGKIFRPFLIVSKDDLITYLINKSQPFRVDSSNKSFNYTRNRVRLELVPLLEKLNPQFSKALLRLRDTVFEESVERDSLNSHPHHWTMGQLRAYLIKKNPKVAYDLKYSSIQNLRHHLIIWKKNNIKHSKIHLGKGWTVIWNEGVIDLENFSLCQSTEPHLPEKVFQPLETLTDNS